MRAQGNRRSRRDREAKTDRIFEEIATTPPGPERERLLREVVALHLDLSDALARKYAGRGLETEDLVQVARLGLVLAVRRYRPGNPGGFPAFAIPTVTGEIKRHFRDHGWVVRPPRRLQELRMATRDKVATAEQELGRTATLSDIAPALGVKPEELEECALADSGFRPVSLDALVPGGGQDAFGDLLTAADSPIEQLADVLTLRSAVAKLTPRQRVVLRLRFVEGATQRQIGDHIGLSQMQVSRIISGTLDALRGALVSEPLAA